MPDSHARWERLRVDFLGTGKALDFAVAISTTEALTIGGLAVQGRLLVELLDATHASETDLVAALARNMEAALRRMATSGRAH